MQLHMKTLEVTLSHCRVIATHEEVNHDEDTARTTPNNWHDDRKDCDRVGNLNGMLELTLIMAAIVGEQRCKLHGCLPHTPSPRFTCYN